MSVFASSPAPELTLAIELSTRQGTVALVHAGNTVEEALDGGAAHASDALPAFERLRARLGLGQALPDCIAVGLGPGSFTGLRVAASTALGLARASGAQLVALPSVHATLAACKLDGTGAALVLDARAGRAYLTLARTSERKQIDAPRAVLWADLVAELAPLLASAHPPRIFADEGAMRHLGESFAGRMEPAPLPTAARLAKLALAQLEEFGPSAASAVRPLYLMDFGAPPA